MSKEVIEAKGKRLSTIAKKTDKNLEEGRDVVINFGRNRNPKRVLESINLLVGKYKVELVVRHAGYKEYFENTLAGGAIGVGLAVVAALLAGGPATLSLILKAVGIGAVAGALIGGGLTQVQRIPTRDTSAVMHSLVEKAEHQIILVGYAVYNCGVLFKALAERMQQQPDLDVWFCLNMFRKHRDTTLDFEIVRRFRADFAKKHWPWEPKPTIYYDPRSLSTDSSKRASLHAKCLIADRSVALVTSANFTEAAQHRNVEVGVIIQYQPLVERLASYFDSLRESGVFARCSP